MNPEILLGMISLQQALMLVLGGFFIAVGFALVRDDVVWHHRAQRVAAIIAGLRRKNNVFYPVYRFQLPDGQMVETTSITGTARAWANPTGKPVQLMYFPGDPRNTRLAGAWTYATGGGMFLLPGIGLFYSGLAEYPITQATWFMLGGVLFFIALWIRKFEKETPRRFTFSAWKQAMKQKHEADMAALPFVRLEDLGSPAAAAPGEETWSDQPAKSQTPWTMQGGPRKPARRLSGGKPLIAIGLLALLSAAHLGSDLREIMFDGSAATGTVTAMHPEPPGLFYPEIRFRDSAGTELTFRDEQGSNPPEFQPGAQVPVRYLPRDPEHTALIDRGLKLLTATAALLLALALGSLTFGITLLFHEERAKQKNKTS